MIKFVATRLLKYLAVFIMFSATHVSLAQVTCNTRKETNEPLSAHYLLESKRNTHNRTIVLTCTDKDDEIKVSLRHSRTGKVLQTFIETQDQTVYLDANTPDLNNDGFADLILPTSIGSPNQTFKVWRYDPTSDRLKLALEGSATEFVKTRSGDIVLHAKGGADTWGYVLYEWKMNRLVPTFSIGETIGASQCTYWKSSGSNLQPVRDSATLAQLNQYCGIGGAGLLDQGENLLQVRNQ